MVKASAYNAGDLGWEDPSGEGNGNPLQYSCLENPMDGWSSLVGYSPCGHKVSDVTERFNFTSLQVVKGFDIVKQK